VQRAAAGRAAAAEGRVVSLLLDALKRAEQEKLAKQGERAEPQRERREPIAMPASSPASAASLELAPINSPSAGAPPRASAADKARHDTAAAQNVFQAKDAPAAERSKKGLVLVIALAVIVALIAGFGLYVWQKIDSFTPRVAASARPRPPAPLTVAPAPPVDATPSFGTILSAPPQQPSAAIQPPPAPEAKKEAPAHAPATGTRDPRDAVAQLLRDAPAARPAPPLKLAPSVERPRVPAEVAAGYESLRNGDTAAARRSYAAALASDPTNLDALLGAATIEARSGNRTLASSHYRRALDVDPRNATAIAGLASLSDYGDSQGLESQLRGEIARNPQSPQLHFTLGNLYASQSRWNDAQVEFFEAHRFDPANADIVFNLAVSLDRLGQARLAAEHYRRALDAASRQATQFDPAAVQRRLAALKP
jgi:Tfp pilus assembly protein PilF